MKKHYDKDATVKIVCQQCAQFFQTPRQCLECSNWNTCLECLRKESEETKAKLSARGIVI